MASKDNNLVSLCRPEDSGVSGYPKRHVFGKLDGSQGITDTLKTTSFLHDAIIEIDELIGGTEDCWDSNNHCDNIKVIAGTIRPTGKYIWTNKGGCKNMTLKCHNVINSGSEVCVDLGNNSEQGEGQEFTRLDLKTVDGSPITIRVLRGSKPELVEGSGPYKYVFPHPDSWYHGICVWILDKLFKAGLI